MALEDGAVPVEVAALLLHDGRVVVERDPVEFTLQRRDVPSFHHQFIEFVIVGKVAGDALAGADHDPVGLRPRQEFRPAPAAEDDHVGAAASREHAGALQPHDGGGRRRHSLRPFVDRWSSCRMRVAMR